jgi:hypothetical protein
MQFTDVARLLGERWKKMSGISYCNSLFKSGKTHRWLMNSKALNVRNGWVKM